EGFKGLTCEIPDAQVVEASGTSGGAIAAAVIDPLLFLAALGVGIWWFYTKKFVTAGRRQRPKPIEPKYQQLVYGDAMDRLFYVTPSVSETKTLLRWQSFEQLLTQQPDFPFIIY